MSRTFEAVLFDLDGTLLDSKPLIMRAFCYAWQRCIKAEPPKARFKQLIGLPLKTMMVTLLKEQCRDSSDSEVERLLVTYRQHLLEHETAMLSTFDGALDTLTRIKRARIPVALVTSKAGAITRRHLDLVGLSALLGAVICQEDTPHNKPHPAPFEAGARRLGVEPGLCLAVGDAPADLLSARAAGMRFAAAMWGADPPSALLAERPDYVLNAPREVLVVLGIDRA